MKRRSAPGTAFADLVEWHLFTRGGFSATRTNTDGLSVIQRTPALEGKMGVPGATEGGTARMHYSHSSREPTGNIKTAPPNRNGTKATGARTGSRPWMCGIVGRCRTGARSKAGSESALRRRRGGSRNPSGPGHGVGRWGCRPHWHRWICASAVVLARCRWTSWSGSRCLRRQLAAVESREIPAVPSAEILFLPGSFWFGELVSFLVIYLIRSVTDMLRRGAEKVTTGGSFNTSVSSFRETPDPKREKKGRCFRWDRKRG